MHLGRPTLQTFLAQQLVGAEHQHQLAALLADVATAVIAIAQMTTRGALGGYLGPHGAVNSQGERQQRLDVLAHEVMLDVCQRSGSVAAMASEEIEQPVVVRDAASGPYLLVFDPLDGSSNIDVNASIGTLFSVLKRPHQLAPDAADFLQSGRAQVAAGYAIYGPSTMLVLTVGRGTHGFTLDRERNQFTLTHADLRIPDDTQEFAINTSNVRFWEAPVQRYVSECQAGAASVRGRDFNTRWVASLVADAHRILMRGGVFLYPKDRKQPPKAGRLRLLYEANPVAWLIEQAGGLAGTGREWLLDLVPSELHQRVPVVFGSRDEVERIQRYHLEHDRGADQPYVSPLFNERSLFRAQELV
ncbi:MAG TPA: class 1 fructose-bisphosphatase [Burkholderiaceae bacterium]|nr:class 1 fructose-bisphosphatase [Burkholderiaceae bacterium]